MMIRHSSLFRVFTLLAVLFGAGLVPFVASSAGNDWTTSDPFRVLDTRPGQITIDMKYAGTSYGDSALYFNTRVNNIPLLGSVTSSSNCYAESNPVLSTTTIV